MIARIFKLEIRKFNQGFVRPRMDTRAPIRRQVGYVILHLYIITDAAKRQTFRTTPYPTPPVFADFVCEAVIYLKLIPRHICFKVRKCHPHASALQFQ